MTTQPLAKIYQPAKTAMQSGRAKTRVWILEYEPSAAMTPDALMGWNSQVETLSQIKLKFPTKEAAIAYAKARNIAYEVINPQARQTGPKSYASNFLFTRRRGYADV